MGWTLLELQAEIGIKKRTIPKVLREDLHLSKTASKWDPWTERQHTRMLLLISMEPWAETKKLYTSVEN